MKLALSVAATMLVLGVGLAHADLTIWQVENNPPGPDSGNEWLTLINTGESDTFTGYILKTTHGRLATYEVPAITLDRCEYHRITFSIQTIDNEDDSVRLIKDGVAVYGTPVIKDTRDSARFWVNHYVAALCGDPQEAGSTKTDPPETVEEPAEPPEPADPPAEPPEQTKDQRIAELEAENAKLRSTIQLLESKIQEILDLLRALLN